MSRLGNQTYLCFTEFIFYSEGRGFKKLELNASELKSLLGVFFALISGIIGGIHTLSEYVKDMRASITLEIPSETVMSV